MIWLPIVCPCASSTAFGFFPIVMAHVTWRRKQIWSTCAPAETHGVMSNNRWLEAERRTLDASSQLRLHTLVGGSLSQKGNKNLSLSVCLHIYSNLVCWLQERASRLYTTLYNVHILADRVDPKIAREHAHDYCRRTPALHVFHLGTHLNG